MVVPYPAGGPTDVIARIVAEEIGKTLGQNVIVENLAGASGAIGTRTVAKAEPDGYTIVFGNNQTHGNNMFLLKEPGLRRDQGLRAARRRRRVRACLRGQQQPPGEVHAGPRRPREEGSGQAQLRLHRRRLRIASRNRALHGPDRHQDDPRSVPRRRAPRHRTDGGPHRRLELDPSQRAGQFQAGQMRAIGLASPQRNPQAPDVPTLREQGITDADAESWAAFFAPVNTPKPCSTSFRARSCRS